MKVLKLHLLIFLAAFLFPAGVHSSEKDKTVSIVNWNLQCFFDAETSGNEYPQFIKNKNWNKDAYETRLKRLCDAIKTINADIFVFEEIENKDILQDISNFLQDFSWNQKNLWSYAAFSKNPGSAIGCGIISRYPVTSLTVHNLYVPDNKIKQPSMRAIMKIKLQIGDENLTLLVNHWKSKAGGEKDSEFWRDCQESLLSALFEKSLLQDEKIIACGDFNRDINEFLSSGKNIILKNPGHRKADKKFVTVKSPWFDENGTLMENGSYFFRKKFEKIDHFFLSENLNLINFELPKGPWCSEEGIPIKYEIYSGKGYSDHNPILCTVSL